MMRRFPILLLLAMLIPVTNNSVAAGTVTTNVPNVLPADPASYQYSILLGKHTVSGVQNALTILVDFQNVHHNKTVDQIRDVAINQLNAYYSEVSYGKVSITGQVFGWYTMNHTIGYYGHDSKHPGDDDNVVALAKDAIAALPSSVNLSQFNFLVIVHAGEDQASDKYNSLSDEIWSGCFCSVFPKYEPSQSIRAGGRSFSDYMFASEFNGVGTFAHEWGHHFGLPDLYDEQAEDSYVGFWSLMDYGNDCCYNGFESTPSYVGGWGDALLGWLSPTVVDSSVQLSAIDLRPLESSSPSSILVPVSSHTYYFIEDRALKGVDSHLPSPAILIYFVDESLSSGEGIVKLVDPTTGNVIPPQSAMQTLNEAVFHPGDKFSNPINQVYITFLGNIGSDVTTLYSRQELAASVIQSNLKVPSPSLTGMFTDELSLSGWLHDQNGNPLIDQPVQAEILDPSSNQWQGVGSGTTDQQGSVSVEANLNYGVGAYMLRLLYPGGKVGGSWYFSSTADISLDITPAKLTITVTAPEVVTTDRFTVQISVAGPRGYAVPNLPLGLYVDSILRGLLKTDLSGKAHYDLWFTLVDLGSHVISARATSNSNYQPTEQTARVLVLPIWIIAPIVIGVVISGVLVVRSKRSRKHMQIAEPAICCPKCGRTIPSDSDFCPECGAKTAVTP